MIEWGRVALISILRPGVMYDGGIHFYDDLRHLWK